MMTHMFLWITQKSPIARRLIFKHFFQKLAGLSSELDWWTFMNYGYVELDDGAKPILLGAKDEPERYCVQLYHHVAEGVDLAGRDVLEVSCGRGGGASYVCRYLGPKSVTAIDISANAIAFCRRVHSVPGLRFLKGDAEKIPVSKKSFDAVINVEASFCYGNIDRFFSEVERVLRPGGYFLYADLRLAHEVDDLMQSLRRSDLVLLQARDITENVVRALEVDNDRRVGAADQAAPLPVRGLIRTFVGVEGTRMPRLLRSRRMQYFNFVLQKPALGAPRSTESAALRRPAVHARETAAAIAGHTAAARS